MVVHTPEEGIDPRILSLIHDYLALTGARQEVVEPGLVRLELDAGDARFFNDRQQHLLASSIRVLECHPDAELPVQGGAFWNGLIAAIRERGYRKNAGLLPVTVANTAAVPDVPTRNARVDLLNVGREQRRLVRVSARLTLSAGVTVEEQLVESDIIDLSTGVAIPDWAAGLWLTPEVAEQSGEIPLANERASEELIPALIDGLEVRLAARIEALQRDSDRTLIEELARIDRYFDSLRQEVADEDGPDSPALGAIEREHRKRRIEETRRHEVRIDVDPVQVVERSIVIERARWRLTSEAGRVAELGAHRYLSGPGEWEIRCERCGRPPEALVVCRSGHATGSECALTCTVCDEAFCVAHGHAACIVDQQAMCSDHGRTCHSCESHYCTGHEAVCLETHHTACANCVKACSVCGKQICLKHGFNTVAEAPRGSRFVCSDCTVYCEGGTSEPVGIDEAARCHTCRNYICERHQVVCAVDGLPHCSTHLKRSDLSRRFMCEEHRATCARDPGAWFASDEVHACVTCGTRSCEKHAAQCHGDAAWHCWEHLVALTDVPTAAACEAHRTLCYVDQRAFSLQGTSPCEVCARSTCRTHTQSCKWCGAAVCSNDLDSGSGRCVTCAKLKVTVDVPDELVSAAARLTERGSVKRWSIARDASRYVVELDLGWTRRIVFGVPHGTAEASRALRHSVFGSGRIG